MQNAERASEDGTLLAWLSKWLWVLSTAFVVLFSAYSVQKALARAVIWEPEYDAVHRNWKGLMVFPALIAHWALYLRARRAEGASGGALGWGAAVIGLFFLTYWKSDLSRVAGWGLPLVGFAVWFATMAAQLVLQPPLTALPFQDAPRVTAPARQLRSAGPVRSALRHPPQLEWWRHFAVLGVLGLIFLAVGREFIGGWNPNDLSVILYMYLGGLFLAYAAVSSIAFAFLRDNWVQAVVAYVLSVLAMGGIVAVMAR
jgi:hypothetical protein